MHKTISTREDQAAKSQETYAGRVVFLTGYIPPYALPVFQALNRYVEELIILVSTDMEKNRSWDADDGGLDVRVQRTTTRNSTWRHGIGFQSKQETHVPWDTLSQLRKLNPDVLISEELGFRSLFASIYQLWRPSKPLLLVCNLSEHTERGRGRIRQILRTWLLKRATGVTVNGISGERYLRKFGVQEQRMFSFPYVSVPGVFDTIPLDRSVPSVRRWVYCGELSPRKGILSFATSLAHWCQRNPSRPAVLTLIGTGESERALKQLALPANLKLELLGFRNYHEVASTMAESSLLVFPTLADEWGLVVNEALAAGLPIAGSIYSQAVEELIEPEKNGWTFDPTSEKDCQRIIETVMECTEQDLKAMRSYCRESVVERTPDWAARKMLQAIQCLTETVP